MAGFKEISKLMHGLRAPTACEKSFQAAVFSVLGPLGFVREFPLGVKGRRLVDFWCEDGGIAIEAKVTLRVSPAKLMRQVMNYARDPRTREVWLLTLRPVALEPEVRGKPLRSINLWRSGL